MEDENLKSKVQIRGGADHWLILADDGQRMRISLGGVVITLDKKFLQPAVRQLRELSEEVTYLTRQLHYNKTRVINLNREIKKLTEELDKK